MPVDTIHFVIDGNKITERMSGEDWETFGMQMEGEQVGPHRIARMAARFMVDEKNEYLPFRKAVREINSLQGNDYTDTLRKFSEAFQEAALPKASGTPSISPSSAGQPTASPDGSTP